VPLHLRFNRFVHGGYRCGLSTSACVRSTAAWHNESLNIWSHAAAAAISLAALLTPWAPPGAPRIHTLLLALATLPMIASFALSIAYHTFMAHATCSTSKGAAARYEALLCADVAGVVGVLSLPQGAIIWYGYHAAPTLRVALALVTAAAALYGTRATTTADQTARALPLGVMVGARLVALALRCAGYGAACAPALARYGVMEVLVALGGAANAAFWPERHFPGKLDCVLNRRV
jgi:predicted membrane channel-forming protein YqfA (hemolysin III family)